MSTCPSDTLSFGDPNVPISGDDTFLNGLITDMDLDLDSPIWSDLNISDEGLGSPGDSISLEDCFQDNSPDFSDGSTNSHSPSALTPPYTPATSDRSSPPFHFINTDSLHSQTTLPERQFLTVNPLPPSYIAHNPLQYYPPQLVSVPPPPSLLLAPVKIQPQSLVLPSFSPSSIAMVASNINQTSQKMAPQTKLSSKNDQLTLKEARRIRNREAANNSRLKQKETMEQLKKQVSKLEKENSDLKQENNQLNIKLKFLENEIQKLKDVLKSAVSGNGKVSKKRTMSALAVIFILGFNFGPMFNVLNSSNRLSPTSSDMTSLGGQSIKESHGRVLLWASGSSNLNLTGNLLYENNETLNNFVGTGSNSSGRNSGKDSADCIQKFFNKTESIRMENDLRGWVQRVKSQEINKNNRDTKRFDRPSFKKPIPVARMKHLMSYTYGNAISDPININGAINSNFNDVFKKNIDKLLQSIHRRSDTFYFVSFSAMDSMLLPAESNGTKTQVRPRFSLIMPSLTTVVNETNASSGVNTTFNLFSMMQIDCEVMNTKTVVVKNLISDPIIAGSINQDRKKPVTKNKNVTTDRKVVRKGHNRLTITS